MHPALASTACVIMSEVPLFPLSLQILGHELRIYPRHWDDFTIHLGLCFKWATESLGAVQKIFATNSLMVTRLRRDLVFRGNPWHDPCLEK